MKTEDTLEDFTTISQTGKSPKNGKPNKKYFKEDLRLFCQLVDQGKDWNHWMTGQWTISSAVKAKSRLETKPEKKSKTVIKLIGRVKETEKCSEVCESSDVEIRCTMHRSLNGLKGMLIRLLDPLLASCLIHLKHYPAIVNLLKNVKGNPWYLNCICGEKSVAQICHYKSSAKHPLRWKLRAWPKGDL